MAQVEIAAQVLDDFDRIFDHLSTHDPAAARMRIGEIVAALDVLKTNPRIGRPAGGDKRELVIGRTSSGYVARYHYAPALDLVVVLAVRSQREAGYRSD